jgi:hypothetical protein
VYDLDDIEDGDNADGVYDQATYDAQSWFYDQDVEIIVEGLDERVDYPYIFCYAEDDEDTLGGLVFGEDAGQWQTGSWYGAAKAKTAPNRMVFDGTAGQESNQNVHTISQDAGGIGTIQTLDESPPIFKTLAMDDPTVDNDRIVVTFTLNEDGTAWCRATRSDSGEVDLKINRILTADWSATYATSGSDSTIEITKLEDKTGSETIKEETQYDIYCWAKDSAVDTHSNARPNYQSQSYVETDVGTNAPTGDALGGKTTYVWVKDTTPPTMIYVASEAIAETTIQVTLQLDEPGTVWCAISRIDGSGEDTTYCEASEIPSTANCGNGAYRTYITSNVGGLPFVQEIHVPYVDYDLNLNLIQDEAGANAYPLKALSGYRVFCFAEDNWGLEAEAANPNLSVNFRRRGGTTGPVEVSNEVLDPAVVQLSANEIGIVVTLDTTPAAFLNYDDTDISQVDEVTLSVTFRLDEDGTVYCKPVRKDFATPTLNEILAYGESVTPCNQFTECVLTVGNTHPLTDKTEYDVHCVSEDNNVYPQVTNLYQAPKVTQATKDETPPTIHVIEAESPYNDRIVVKLQLNEIGTVWCASRPSANVADLTTSYIRTNGDSVIVDNSVWFVDQNTEVVVTGLEEEVLYVTSCTAIDTPTSPFFVTANEMTQGATDATRPVLGDIITLDVSPPKFTALKGEGTGENEITVTFELNEDGTAYCRATRSDSGEATMHINRILKADWTQTYVTSTSAAQTIVIDKLENDATSSALELGTYYDVFCWIRDAAVKHSCRAGPDGANPAICGTTYVPVGQTQTYVDTQFGGSGGLMTPPDFVGVTNGGKIATPGVRTRDKTPPTIVFVEAESTAETSITITLQLSEPGTVYCEAYNGVTVGPNVKSACSYSSCQYVVATWAETYRNFEVTVTQAGGLTMETNYYVYCGGEDDESVETQYSGGGGAVDTNNIAAIILTESTGRYTLDLTPPIIQVNSVVSLSEPTLTVNVQLDEPGTVWCLAVRDNFDAPTINQIIAADYSAVETGANQPFNVVILALTRDTEYDTYCFARDRGTENGAVSPNPGNDITFATVLSTKRDVHTIGDSTYPFIPEPPQSSGFVPAQSTSGVNNQETIVLTFSEDITTSNDVQSDPATYSLQFYDVTGSGSNNRAIDFSSGNSAGLITIVNNVMTIDFDAGYSLNPSTQYDVVVDPGVLVDLANNPFPGLGDATRNTDPLKQVYSFTTA